METQRERPTMQLAVRFKIALGSAKGLAYLHTDCRPRIIHLDIKSDNILIDHQWEAKSMTMLAAMFGNLSELKVLFQGISDKFHFHMAYKMIADFGLARIFPDDNTHIEVSRMAGTIGYFPPEYGSTGELTDKSDVYSFGVILLELITGELPPRLVASKKRYLEGEEYDSIIDPHLKKNYDPIEMKRLVKCAAACVRQNPQSRPTMYQVYLALAGHIPLNELNEDAMDGNRIQRSYTLNPSILSSGSGETGSITYYSVISVQGNVENEDDRTTVNPTHDSPLTLRQSSGRQILSRTM